MPILYEQKIGWCFWELMLGSTQFSRGDNPIQGIIYPDGTCRDASEVAAVMNLSVEHARVLFPQRERKPQANTAGAKTTWEARGKKKEKSSDSR